MDEGTYVAYAAHATDWAATGADIAAFASQALAQAACYQQAACIGIKYDTAGGAAPWKTFGGAACAACTAKVRVTGPAIDPWLAEPDNAAPLPGEGVQAWAGLSMYCAACAAWCAVCGHLY